jgi:hypothetical protein
MCPAAVLQLIAITEVSIFDMMSKQKMLHSHGLKTQAAI